MRVKILEANKSFVNNMFDAAEGLESLAHTLIGFPTGTVSMAKGIKTDINKIFNLFKKKPISIKDLNENDEKLIDYLRNINNYKNINAYLKSVIKLQQNSMNEAERTNVIPTPMYFLNAKGQSFTTQEFLKRLGLMHGQPDQLGGNISSKLSLTNQVMSASIDKLLKIYMTNILSYEKIKNQIVSFQRKSLDGKNLSDAFYKYMYDGFWGKFIIKIKLSSDNDEDGIKRLGFSSKTVDRINKHMNNPRLSEKEKYEKVTEEALLEALKIEKDLTKKENLGLQFFQMAMKNKKLTMDNFRKHKWYKDIMDGTLKITD